MSFFTICVELLRMKWGSTSSKHRSKIFWRTTYFFAEKRKVIGAWIKRNINLKNRITWVNFFLQRSEARVHFSLNRVDFNRVHQLSRFTKKNVNTNTSICNCFYEHTSKRSELRRILAKISSAYSQKRCSQIRKVLKPNTH